MNIRPCLMPHSLLEGLVEIPKIMEPEMELKPETVSVSVAWR